MIIPGLSGFIAAPQSLELPRVGPFASQPQTFVDTLPNLNTGEGTYVAQTTRAAPLKKATITIPASVVNDIDGGFGSVYIWCNVLNLGTFDASISATGSGGASAAAAFYGGQGGKGFNGGGGGGACDFNATDVGFGGQGGGDAGNGETGFLGADSIEGSPGGGGEGIGPFSDGFAYANLPEIGGAGGSAVPGEDNAAGGGGGSGFRMVIVANEGIFNASSNYLDVGGGGGGAGVGSGESGATGGPGILYLAFRKYDGNANNLASAAAEVYEIQGEPGSFSLVARSITDSWNNL